MADTILTPMQKKILEQFEDYMKGLTIEEICEGPEHNLDMPITMVTTTLKELTFLGFLRTSTDTSNGTKWFITYEGLRAVNQGYLWP